MNNLIFVLLMAFIDVIVLSLMKYQLMNYNPYYFLIAFLFYGIQPIIFYYSLKNGGGLGTNNILWDLMSDLLVIIIAIAIFNEHSSRKQTVGIILAFVSMYLLR
jgi:multidrug transporter EmrE-like cation transporter